VNVEDFRLFEEAESKADLREELGEIACEIAEA